MRYVILGVIGILWGGGVLYRTFSGIAPMRGGAYGDGQVIGMFLAGMMVFAGLYFLVKGLVRVGRE